MALNPDLCTSKLHIVERNNTQVYYTNNIDSMLNSPNCITSTFEDFLELISISNATIGKNFEQLIKFIAQTNYIKLHNLIEYNGIENTAVEILNGKEKSETLKGILKSYYIYLLVSKYSKDIIEDAKSQDIVSTLPLNKYDNVICCSTSISREAYYAIDFKFINTKFLIDMIVPDYKEDLEHLVNLLEKLMVHMNKNLNLS